MTVQKCVEAESARLLSFQMGKKSKLLSSTQAPLTALPSLCTPNLLAAAISHSKAATATCCWCQSPAGWPAAQPPTWRPSLPWRGTEAAGLASTQWHCSPAPLGAPAAVSPPASLAATASAAGATSTTPAQPVQWSARAALCRKLWRRFNTSTTPPLTEKWQPQPRRRWRLQIPACAIPRLLSGTSFARHPCAPGCPCWPAQRLRRWGWPPGCTAWCGQRWAAPLLSRSPCGR